jgi:hypothetical protein
MESRGGVGTSWHHLPLSEIFGERFYHFLVKPVKNTSPFFSSTSSLTLGS